MTSGLKTPSIPQTDNLGFETTREKSTPRAAPAPELPSARNFLQNLQAITRMISLFDSLNNESFQIRMISPNELIFIDNLMYLR
jgi:hypothetical protein